MKNNKNLAIAIIIVVSAVILAALIWPLTEQRNASIDRAIESDFSTISTLVDEYYSDERRLPDELSDLKLDDDLKSRAGKYGYVLDKESARTYELCANFKTDTSQDDEPTDIYLSSSFYASRAHTAGYSCIEYEVFSYYYDDFDEPSVFDSFLNQEGGIDGFEALESFDFEEL